VRDFYLTTAILFEDRHIEGQVLHVGTEEDCKRVAALLPAVTYSGGGKPVQARLSMFKNTEANGGPMRAGQLWYVHPSDAFPTPTEGA